MQQSTVKIDNELMPSTEIPDSEMWLCRNEKVLRSVREGLKDAAEGKISKLDRDEL